jgi:Spy/CpxP family protein refolding chaperone
MARQFRWILAAVFACTVSSAQSALAHPAPAVDCEQQKPEQKAQPGSDRRPGDRAADDPRFKWWEDPKSRTELGISDRQSEKIKNIFEPEMMKIRVMRDERVKLEATLEQLVKEDRPNLAALTEKWDRVGYLLSEMYKARQLMIFKIDRALKPEQRVKLQAMFERMQNERRQKEPDRHR